MPWACRVEPLASAITGSIGSVAFRLARNQLNSVDWAPVGTGRLFLLRATVSGIAAGETVVGLASSLSRNRIGRRIVGNSFFIACFSEAATFCALVTTSCGPFRMANAPKPLPESKVNDWPLYEPRYVPHSVPDGVLANRATPQPASQSGAITFAQAAPFPPPTYPPTMRTFVWVAYQFITVAWWLSPGTPERSSPKRVGGTRVITMAAPRSRGRTRSVCPGHDHLQCRMCATTTYAPPFTRCEPGRHVRSSRLHRGRWG